MIRWVVAYSKGGDVLVPTFSGGRSGRVVHQAIESYSIVWRQKRGKRCQERVHSGQDFSSKPLLEDAALYDDQYSSVPPRDDVDRALLRMQKYLKDPMSAVTDLKIFVGGSIRLMRHLYTPGARKSLFRACSVLVVVVAFMMLIWGLDVLLRNITRVV